MSPVSADYRSAQIALITTYHNSARAELVHRLAQRDGALALFLAATAAVFGTVLRDGAISRGGAAFLLVIPMFGLGASSLQANVHSMIGLLNLYIARDLHVMSAEALGAGSPDGPTIEAVPKPWDGSDALLHGIREVEASRIAGTIFLLIGPQVAACTAAIASAPFQVSYILACTAGVAATALSGRMLVASTRHRRRVNGEVLAYYASLDPGPALAVGTPGTATHQSSEPVTGTQ